MSGADFFSDESPINPYYGVEKIDLEKAKNEHNSIKRAFESAGIEVIQVAPPKDCQDGVYTANWALCRNDRAVLSRLPDVRRGEHACAKKALQKAGYGVLEVPDDWLFSGQGDSLSCGKYLLAGSGYRSDSRAQQFAAEALGFELIQLHTLPKTENGEPVINKSSGLPDSFFYDIDLAVSILRDDLIAYCPEALDEQSRAKMENLPIEKIIVDLDEAMQGLACNLVSTGETVIMSAHAPKLQTEIEKCGLKTILVDAPELSKGGGYIRCVSLTLN